MQITFDTVLVYFVFYFGLFIAVFFLIMFIESKEKLKSPRAKKFPKVSVIIPAYNEEGVITKTIESVLSLDYPKDKLELIVIDDGSTDKTYEIAKKYENKNVKVFTKKNGGKASALNFGIKRCSGEFILILDADCFPGKGLLKKMIGHFKNPRVMTVIPTLGVWKPKSIIERMQVVEYAISAFIRKLTTFIHSLNVAPGAALYRAEFFKKYGGFDENNLTEDFEMGMRVQSKHYDVAHALEASVRTVVPNTFKKLMRQRVRWSYGNLWNLKKYSFMFALKYGDLGVFYLPVMAITMGITVFLLFYYLFMLLWDVVHSIYLLSLIGYDIPYYFSSIQLIQIINAIFSMKAFLLSVLFLVGLVTYILAKKSIKKGKFKFEFLVYTLIYGWILILFHLIGLIYFCVRKKPRW